MIGRHVHETTANTDLHLYAVHDLGHDLCQAHDTQNKKAHFIFIAESLHC